MIGAYCALAMTHYFSGNFEIFGQYTMRAVRIWRSGGVQFVREELDVLGITCLCYEALFQWHLGEIASSQTTVAEAISLAKELNDRHGLAVALFWAARLYLNERHPSEVERLTSELIELSTRQNFPHWLALGIALRGWARSASGDLEKGLAWIEDGIEDWVATGAVLQVPFYLALKSEALYLANRTSEALEAINEAEALVERFEDRHWCAELQRLRGLFLAALGSDEAQIEASFREAIRTALEQKSISLAKRAEATYAEYRRQKAGGSGQGQLPLPL
jgi:adenylate cyclase